MGEDSYSELNVEWDTDDECGFPEPNTSESSPNNNLIQHFVKMGFSENMVVKAIEENGKDNTESILEFLLTCSVLDSIHPENPVLDIVAHENSHPEDPALDILALENTFQENPCHDDSDFSSDYEAMDFSDFDSCSEDESTSEPPPSEKRQKLLFLVDMGYPIEEASIALERCGSEASVVVLTDFLTAAQMARATDATLPPEIKTIPTCSSLSKKRKHDIWSDRKRPGQPKRSMEDDETLRLPKPMIGFGVPSGPTVITERKLPESSTAPPFFYYENVALAPKGVWQTIMRFLGDIEPEFVDSKYFCAAARKRGYIHNLPIEGRYPVLPLPPSTIHEALPLTKRWWPKWDQRTKLNCLQTVIGSARTTDRILKKVENWETPPLENQKYVMDLCKKWNLVWVGRNKVAPLEPDEVEMLLGFPKNHTRGGGISRTDRYKSLGNSFQVDTVAYHLSVLKKLFPNGINVLSLFSGIGGAEVALHRLGIPLKMVVSVEISETNRSIQRCWWDQTNQKGTLLDIRDVQELTTERLEELIETYGAFDLVIGGSPCNNLAGSNRVHRSGLEGKESSLFFDYYRILDAVRSIMGRQQ